MAERNRRYPRRVAVRALVDAARDADRRGLAVVVVLAVVTSVAEPLTGLWLRYLLDGVLDRSTAAVTASAVALAGSVGAVRLLGRVTWLRMMTLQERTAARLDQDLMATAGGIAGLDHHERPEYADEMELLRQQRGLLGWAMLSIVGVLQVTAAGTTSLVLLGSVEPLLLLFPVLAVATVWATGRAERRRQDGLRRASEQSRLGLHLYDLAVDPAAARELRVFAAGPGLLDRHTRAWQAVHRVRDRAEAGAAALETVGWLVFVLGFSVTVLFTVDLAVSGAVSAGELFLVLTIALMLNGQVAGVVTGMKDASGLLQVVDRYLWLRSLAEEATAPADPVPVPSRLRRGLVLEQVGFTYPSVAEPALRGVDLVLPAGRTVALVGDNGAGKTTLVKLLCGFYQPTTGRITVDGIDLASVRPEDWRRHISAAFQDHVAFEFLARQTVGIGDLSAVDDEARVGHAVHRAGADEVVGGLPAGLDTALGSSLPDGVELSGGQWQRLALSRAMMRRSPLLLVLDEPTASVDARAEYALFERYARAAAALRDRGTVTVLITHRFSSVRMADLIVVVDDGRVVEVGRHDELIAAKGLYAEMYNTQAAGFR